MANPNRLPRNSGCDACDTGTAHLTPCTAWQSPEDMASAEQYLREYNIFGCSAKGMTLLVAQLVSGPYPTGLLAGAMRLLSDSQEMIELGRLNEARQAINRAKFLIDEQRKFDRSEGR